MLAFENPKYAEYVCASHECKIQRPRDKCEFLAQSLEVFRSWIWKVGDLGQLGHVYKP